MVRLFFLGFLTLLILNSCVDQRLVLIRNSNMVDLPIEIDGYYMLDSKDNKTYNSAQLFVFYSNGIVAGGAYYSLDSLQKHQNNLDEYINSAHKSKTHWGVYIVRGRNLSIEKWEPSSGGGMKTVIRSGTILNDTTFILTERFNHYNNKEDAIQDTFRFHQYYPKPDSTNRFIK